MAYTVLHSDTVESEIAETIVFASGYALTELLRLKRAHPSVEQRPPLLCENALFLFPCIADSLGKQLLGWPHWILKYRYTQLGLLFGKFWKNERETSKDGRELPVPPSHFLSVRESVRAKDLRFFEQTEWLRPALESSSDIGQNVFEDLADHHEALDVLSAFLHEPTLLHFERATASLAQSGFYSRVKNLAAIELEAHKRHNTN